MNTSRTLAILAVFACLSTSALAADGGEKKSQTSRMSQCSAQAKEQGLKGDARKEHMSQCLRSPVSQAAAKECGATATEKGLKGQRRKEFVSECVKGKSAGGTVG